MRSYSGYTSKTPEHLLLDAGAFFKNFDVKLLEQLVNFLVLLKAVESSAQFHQ